MEEAGKGGNKAKGDSPSLVTRVGRDTSCQSTDLALRGTHFRDAPSENGFTMLQKTARSLHGGNVTGAMAKKACVIDSGRASGTSVKDVREAAFVMVEKNATEHRNGGVPYVCRATARGHTTSLLVSHANEARATKILCTARETV